MQEEKFLSRDTIHSINDEKYEVVYVDEWGGNVRLYVMNGRERLAIEECFIQDSTPKLDVFIRLLALCLKDETGQRIFLDDEINKLGEKSSAVTSKLIAKCLDLNGLSPNAKEEIKKK